MKKGFTKFAAMLLFVVMALTVSACNVRLTSYQEATDTDKLLATGGDGAEGAPVDGAQYNKYGKFYEKIDNEMLYLREKVAVSSLYRFEMGVSFDEEDATCEFSTNYGVLGLPGNLDNADRALTVAPGEKCTWGYYKYTGEVGQFPTVYITVTVRSDGNIIAYGLMKITTLKTPNGYEVVKFALIPQLNDEPQTVTDEQIQAAVEGAKEKGEFLTLSEVYESGDITRQDLLDIAYYNNCGITESNKTQYPEGYVPTPKNPEKLDDDTKQKIEADLVSANEEYRTHENILIAYVLYYYGTYGDYIAVKVDLYNGVNIGGAGFDMSFTVDNVVIQAYGSPAQNLYWGSAKLMLYKAYSGDGENLKTGTFYGLQEAYEKGLINKEDLQNIAFNYNTKNYDKTVDYGENFTPTGAPSDTLSDKVKTAVKEAFCRKHEITTDMYDEVTVLSEYYGFFGGCYIVDLTTTCLVGGDPVVFEEYEIDGVGFYNYHNIGVYKVAA